MAATVRGLRPDANSFTANGNKYLIHSSLSVARFREFERLQVIAGFGADYQTLYQQTHKAYGELNAMKVADAAVTLNGILEGMSRPLNGQQHPMLLLCSLFVSKPGEDLAAWNEAEATEKIKDWEASGMNVQDFFTLALRLVRQFHNALQDPSQNTLEATEHETESNPAESYSEY